MTLPRQLDREHRLICEVLDALDAYALSLKSRVSDRSALADFMRFVLQYVDEIHHAAEEDLLFPAMTRHGFSSRMGPVACMLGEHERGRALVRELILAAQREEQWDASERARVATDIFSFTSLLRAHIAKEDQVLYPLALETLPEAVMDELNAECDRLVERTATRRAHLEHLAASLCAGVTRAASQA